MSITISLHPNPELKPKPIQHPQAHNTPPPQHSTHPTSRSAVICCYPQQHYSPTLWRSEWS
eukprot:1007457-Amorphochlora_amoeboformis.AAC.1